MLAPQKHRIDRRGSSFFKMSLLVVIGFSNIAACDFAVGDTFGLGRNDGPAHDLNSSTRLGHDSSPVASNTLKSLLEVQRRVQNTVRDNMPAVVSISDGIGFGSGVVVNEQGLILTAGHVVNGDVDEFEIFFPSGKTTIAKMLGYNLSVDAAMLQIVEPGPWPHAKLAESQTTPKIGDWVVCMGHSGGYELGRLPPVRTGRVLEYRDHLLVTDAVLIGGDSGGPLFDLNGHVIGIHSSIGDSISENRHVSLATFRRDWQKMAGGTKWGALPNFASVEPEKKPSPEKPLEKGRARLGIQMEQNENAAIVETVERNSAAARVGIKPGDSVLMFDNIKIKNYRQLVELIRSKNIGDSVAIEIQRRGQTLKLQVILDEFK